MGLIKKITSIITIKKIDKEGKEKEILLFYTKNEGLPKSISKEIDAILNNKD